jgi:hypothetical protein
VVTIKLAGLSTVNLREVAMPDEPTCGTGLAEHSALPAKLGDLMAGLADVLDAHTKALVMDDPNARLEHDAYTKVIGQHRGISTQLHTAASQMAGYRELPSARHDEEALADPEAAEAFRRFVALEQEPRHPT